MAVSPVQVSKEKEEDDSNPAQREELTKTCYTTLGQAWPRCPATQGERLTAGSMANS